MWSAKAEERQGKLRLTREDLTPQAAHTLRNLFYTAVRKAGRTHLVEKFPENVFRLDYLQAVFPGCRVIMVKRNPVGTARSISRFNPRIWYGVGHNHKLNQLLSILPEFEQEFSFSDEFIARMMSNDCIFSKALVEWTLSVLCANSFRQSLGDEEQARYLELNVEEFGGNPEEISQQILEFMGLSRCDNVRMLAANLFNQSLIETTTNSMVADESAILELAGPIMSLA